MVLVFPFFICCFLILGHRLFATNANLDLSFKSLFLLEVFTFPGQVSSLRLKMSMAISSITGKCHVRKRKEGLKNSCRLHTCNIIMKAMSQRQKSDTNQAKEHDS